jgi:anti-anti-sigma factor
MAWTVKVREHKSFPCIHVEGYIDLEGGRNLRQSADTLVRLGKNRIIIDFTECKLINSTGLADLLDFVVNFVEDLDGKIILIAVSKSLIDIFQMVRLSQFAKIVPTIDHVFQEWGTK